MTSQDLSMASATLAKRSINSMTVPSPSFQQQQQSSFGMRRNIGLKTIATTPPPPSTTTEPPPDLNSYEKSIFQGRISDVNLNMLKEQIRIMNGLPRTIEEKLKRTKQFPSSPEVRPRETITSRRRTELMQRRLIVRCSNLKEKYDEYERMIKSENMDELYRQLRDATFEKNAEEIYSQFEREELENLKYLANRAKENEETGFRDNYGSKLRVKFIRGEPILSSVFRASYREYLRPPFVVAPGTTRPKLHHVPKLNKDEIWLVPVDDVGDVPLHQQPKTPDPKDKRPRTKRDRPKIKRGKRTPRKESAKKEGKLKRPPWTYPSRCAPYVTR